MASYYKLSGTSDRHTNWTTAVILERDEDGNVTKEARVGEPLQLNADDRKKLESLGFTVEESSKDEADEFEAAREASPVVGSDVVGSSPSFDSGVDQNSEAN